MRNSEKIIVTILLFLVTPTFGQQLLKKDNGNIWIATSKGILVLDSNLLFKERITIPTISNDTVSKIIEDKNKNTWINTKLYIHKINNDNSVESFTQYIEGDSNSETITLQKVNKSKKTLNPRWTNLIKTINTDTIWVITSSELFYIHNDSIINTNMSLIGVGPIATNEGIFAWTGLNKNNFKFSNGRWIEYKSKKKRYRNIDYSVLEYTTFSNDFKWLSTNEGLFALKGKRAEKISELVFRVSKTMPNNEVWFGGDGGIAILTNNSRLFIQNISYLENIEIATNGNDGVNTIQKISKNNKNIYKLSYVTDFIAIDSNRYLILDKHTELFLFDRRENSLTKIKIL